MAWGLVRLTRVMESGSYTGGMSVMSIVVLAVLPGLLVASGFFSGTETALFSLTRHQRTQLARQKGLAAHAVTGLLGQTRELLITLLMGNMTVNVLYFTLTAVLLHEWTGDGEAGWGLPGWAAVVLAVVPLLGIVVLGEVLPKLVAAKLPMRWSRVAGVPLLVVHRVLTPVRVVASVAVITPLARLIAPASRPPELDAGELESMLRLSQRHGVIDPGEEELLQGVLDLSQLRVRELMVPRVDVVAFDLDRDPGELIEMIRRDRLRHVPVYDGDLDSVRGMVYGRQVLLKRPTTRQEVQRLIRQVRYVPELQRADRLLIDMRKTGTTFAIAVDEYGGTAGLITLEDVVEHLVGDIAGEHEPVGEEEVVELGGGRWRVAASLPVHDWPAVFGRHRGLDLAAQIGAVSTIGGLVMSRLGRVPHVGDTVTLGNLTLRVERTTGRRVQSVVVELGVGEMATDAHR